MAVDLRKHVLSLRAVSEQSHQLYVVVEGTAHVSTLGHVVAHQSDQRLERGWVVVEQQHILTRIHQLKKTHGRYVIVMAMTK